MTALRVNAITAAIAVAALLVLGGAGGYWWAHQSMAARDAMSADHPSGSAPGQSGEASGKGKILYWHDPMKPDIKFDKPGKSPFMDMPLVPVYVADAGEADGIRVSPNVVQNLGIRLGKVEKLSLSSELHAVGNVAFDEQLLELVQTRVEGYVMRLYIKAPLVRVRRGEPLAEIQAPAWLEAEQEYLSLLDAKSASARSLLVAARERLRVLGVPPQTIHAIEKERKTQATTMVYAPIDGVVSDLAVREGSAFMPGASLFRINGLSTVWVNAQIPESRVSSVPIGSSAEVRATAWPGTPFKGRVIALLPEIATETRTLTARVEVDNPERKLTPGMYVSLTFTGAATEPQLVVSSEALITTGQRNVVILAREDGSFAVANVTTGPEADGKTTVLSGLKEHQSVVLSGQFLLDSEASLKATVNRLETPSTEPRP